MYIRAPRHRTPLGGISTEDYNEEMVRLRAKEIEIQRQESRWSTLQAIATAVLPLAAFFGVRAFKDLKR